MRLEPATPERRHETRAKLLFVQQGTGEAQRRNIPVLSRHSDGLQPGFHFATFAIFENQGETFVLRQRKQVFLHQNRDRIARVTEPTRFLRARSGYHKGYFTAVHPIGISAAPLIFQVTGV